MRSSDYLTNHFLIAMPSLVDPNFSRTVTYVCEHNEDGAMGIVINRPSEVHLGELLTHLGLASNDDALNQRPVYAGGPVQRERGFVLHPSDQSWDGSLPISCDLSVTTSKDILDAIARQEGPEEFLVALGYAGWGPGQLETEMIENSWLSGPADTDILFNLDHRRRWQAAADLLGVDMALLSPDSGHA